MTITLVVETGAKPANANTYVSLIDCEAYHTTYANTAWTGVTDDELKKQALVLASQAIDLLYGAKYMSYIYSTSSQVFLFPRMQFYDANQRLVTDTTIPLALKNAVCELALKQLNGEDIFPTASTASNVKSETVTAGSVTLKTDRFGPDTAETFEGFNKIDMLMRPILKQQMGSWSLKA